MDNIIVTAPNFYDEEHVLRVIEFVNRLSECYPNNDTILQLLREYQFHVVVADMYERARDECEDTDDRRVLHRENILHLKTANCILGKIFKTISGIN